MVPAYVADVDLKGVGWTNHPGLVQTKLGKFKNKTTSTPFLLLKLQIYMQHIIMHIQARLCHNLTTAFIRLAYFNILDHFKSKGLWENTKSRNTFQFGT